MPPGEQRRPQVQSAGRPANVAPLAQVEASSTDDKYDPRGAIDRIPEDYPGDMACEWASKGEGIRARLKLAFTVTAVKPDSPNIGLSEIAVFK